MSWLSYQTQPTYFAMRIRTAFSDTPWLIEPFLSAKAGETKKINHVIELNISYMQWKDHTDQNTRLWDLYRSGFINRLCFKTTRGQTLIKLNLSCMSMNIWQKQILQHPFLDVVWSYCRLREKYFSLMFSLVNTSHIHSYKRPCISIQWIQCVCNILCSISCHIWGKKSLSLEPLVNSNSDCLDKWPAV